MAQYSEILHSILFLIVIIGFLIVLFLYIAKDNKLSVKRWEDSLRSAAKELGLTFTDNPPERIINTYDNSRKYPSRTKSSSKLARFKISGPFKNISISLSFNDLGKSLDCLCIFASFPETLPYRLNIQRASSLRRLMNKFKNAQANIKDNLPLLQILSENPELSGRIFQSPGLSVKIKQLFKDFPMTQITGDSIECRKRVYFGSRDIPDFAGTIILLADLAEDIFSTSC